MYRMCKRQLFLCLWSLKQIILSCYRCKISRFYWCQWQWQRSLFVCWQQKISILTVKVEYAPRIVFQWYLNVIYFVCSVIFRCMLTFYIIHAYINCWVLSVCWMCLYEIHFSSLNIRSMLLSLFSGGRGKLL